MLRGEASFVQIAYALLLELSSTWKRSKWGRAGCTGANFNLHLFTFMSKIISTGDGQETKPERSGRRGEGVSSERWSPEQEWTTRVNYFAWGKKIRPKTAPFFPRESGEFLPNTPKVIIHTERVWLIFLVSASSSVTHRTVQNSDSDSMGLGKKSAVWSLCRVHLILDCESLLLCDAPDPGAGISNSRQTRHVSSEPVHKKIGTCFPDMGINKTKWTEER